MTTSSSFRFAIAAWFLAAAFMAFAMLTSVSARADEPSPSVSSCDYCMSFGEAAATAEIKTSYLPLQGYPTAQATSIVSRMPGALTVATMRHAATCEACGITR